VVDAHADLCGVVAVTSPALSVRRPWAHLIIRGSKPVENRTWVTRYRGRVWLHAGQGWDPAGAALAARLGLLAYTDPANCPTGYLGTVDLTGMHPCTPVPCCTPWGQPGPDVWHWQITDPRPVTEPIPGPGRLGLYQPPAYLADQSPETRPNAHSNSGPSRCLDCAAALHLDRATGAMVDQWGQPTCGASCRAHSPDLPALPAEPAGRPANSMTDRRTERGGLILSAGAGAVPPLPVPHQGRFAPPRAVRPQNGRLLDPGHPAAAVSGAPAGSREEHAPVRPGTGPRSPR
jgi:hypothetical protein